VRRAPGVSFTTHIFREGPMYVTYVPALDVSSRGFTGEEVRANIRDAVRGSLAASAISNCSLACDSRSPTAPGPACSTCGDERSCHPLPTHYCAKSPSPQHLVQRRRHSRRGRHTYPPSPISPHFKRKPPPCVGFSDTLGPNG